MPLLKKILKPKFLQEYLEKAVLLADGCAFAAVADGEDLLAAAGALPENLEPQPGAPGTVWVPLHLENEEVGRLILGKTETAGTNLDMENLGSFLGSALDSLIDREAVRRDLAKETLEQYRDTALIQRAILNLNRLMKQQEVVDVLLTECRERSYKSDVGMVFLRNPATDELVFFDMFGSYSAGELKHAAQSELFKDVVRRREPEIVNDLAGDARWSNEVEGLVSMMIFPLATPATVHGVLALAGGKDAPPFDSLHLKRIGTLSTVAGIALSNAYNFEQIQEILNSLMQAMATTIDSRDHCTAGHSHRVARYARKLLQIAALDPSATHGIKIKEPELHEIYYAGLLHDVGKIGVREEVLTKSARLPSAHIELIGLRLTLWGRINDFPWEDDLSRLERINRAYELANDDIEFIKRLSGELLEIGGKTTTILSRDEAERLLTPWGNLTRKEWEEIKRHPTESQRILANIPFSNFFPKLPTMILQHHERLDGSGYPHGVKGDEILLQSRVLAIVDVYDSLRRDRHYKKAQPKSMALKILREEAALNKLDPLLVEIFCENVDLIEEPAHMDLYIPPYQACPQ